MGKVLAHPAKGRGLPRGTTRVTMAVAGHEPVDITSALDRAGAFKGRLDKRQGEAFAPGETGEAMAGDQLRSLVERIERLDEERRTISDDIKEVFVEAKAHGYDVKVLRKVIALRKRDLRERREEEAILDLYLQAVGESR